MRDIKFRLWLKQMKKMVYSGFIILSTGEARNTANTGGCGTYEIMQYTGLKDANDKDMYEGDIIEDNVHGTVKRIFKINDIRTIDREFGNSEHSSEWYVIGNIYESPELCPVK